MSGHSKWHNIQKTKGAADAKRAQAFTKIAREMIVAVKEGGGGEDTVMMDALDAGAAVFEEDGDVMYVYTAEDDVASVADALTEKGYKLLSAQVEMLPQNGYIKLTNEDDIKNMQKMLDMFEDNDDVQNVWHNWEDAE